MRLIDADKMLERLEVWNTSDNTDKALYNFAWNRIAEQPTAYDIDRVIEQLKKLIDDKVGFLRSTPEANCYIQAINDAIEIVKRGGVE